METARIVLDYLKVVLSPQVIAAGATIAFFLIFREDFQNLLRRIAKIRLPGGSELLTSQAERSTDERSSRSAKLPAPRPDEIKLPQAPNLPQEELEQVRQAFQAERAKAYLWEYRYLNYFLVPHTQRVLDWLISADKRTSISLFDTFWIPAIPSAQERQAILRALESHHLIQLSGELIEVTPKGKEYAQWRGPLALATGHQ